jgi:hypothetical protein
MVGGRIDFSQVQDPSQFSDDRGEEEAAPVRTAKTKKKKVVEEPVEEQEPVQEVAPRPAPVRRLEKPMFTF